jgi:TATA-box binding protein (TBP) (component of TFIID and TFIIIB)
MILTTNNSPFPQRLYDVHNILQMLDSYYNKNDTNGNSFTGIITELEDYKGLLLATVSSQKYRNLGEPEKDNLHARIENIWTRLYHEEDIEIVDSTGILIYQSWQRSPRARRSLT